MKTTPTNTPTSKGSSNTPRGRWLIGRRSVLRGAGVAVALPLLDAMVPPGKAHAQMAPKRFIPYYTAGGTVIDVWRPTGTESNFTLQAILKPLDPVKSQLLVIDGLEMKVTQEGYGHPHTRGMAGALTGQPTLSGPYETCGGKAGFANGPSIDQVIAGKIGADRKFKSLYLAVRWPTMFYGGARISPTNILNYEAANKPIPPETNPRMLYDKLFKDLTTGIDQLTIERARSKSILDTVGNSYTAMTARLGAEDRLKLEAHLAKIREVEQSLDALSPPAGAMCAPNLGAALNGPFATDSAVDRCDGCVESPNDQLIPQTGKVMMDIAALALACDLTRVITFQWMDLAANNSFPWLSLSDTHHGYQHDRGYQPNAIEKIDAWFAGQYKYFIDQLMAVKEGDKTLLDSASVFWFKEISHPQSHSHVDMPYVIAGSAGGAFRTGRYMKYNRLPHNNLLVSLLNAYGVSGSTFGKAQYCTGPLAGLT